MTKLKTKKTLASILALSLTLALMATTAFAAPAARSSGDIEFTPYDNTGDGILDPGDKGDPPPDVDDEDLTDEEKDALANLDSMDIYFGEHEVIMENKTYLSADQNSQAGLLVKSGYDGWEVRVEVSEFYLNSTTATTLDGFGLKLIPDASSYAEIGTAAIAPETVELEANQSALISSGTKGIMGCNFDGELFVVGGTAEEGQAQAELNWAFTAGTP